MVYNEGGPKITLPAAGDLSNPLTWGAVLIAALASAAIYLFIKKNADKYTIAERPR